MAAVQVNPEILVNLKCVVCDCHLSCSPVMLKSDGDSVCGRCPSPEKQATRNKPYEQLASMMAFPCRYQQQGCVREIPFRDIKQHEETCKFRTVMCPVVAAGSCNWLGPRHKILQHCREKHPNQVLQHPCLLKHDITRNSLHTYITTAFNVLFLVHTKVCITTAKIYHSVRLINDSGRASNYNYQLDIKNENDEELLRKKRVVAPEGCMALQEDSSISTGINNFLEFLGKFQGTTFKITINKVLKPVTCVICESKVIQPTSRNSDGWLCVTCAPPKTPCVNRNQGCKHSDISTKHAQFFCNYTKECWICKNTISGTLEKHYMLQHVDITHQYGTGWSTTLTENYQWFITTTNIGFIICAYRLTSTEFNLEVLTPLKKDELSQFTCEIRLKNPKTNHFLNYTVFARYDHSADWTLDVEIEKIKQVLVNNQFDMTLEVW